MLLEPNQTEKEAFNAILGARWKAIREHFKIDEATGNLIVPPALSRMKACFPDSTLLPTQTDKDGSQWIESIGPVRADLQLSALALVWEFQFLVPAENPDQQWTDAIEKLNGLLATPAIDNLREARSLLRQLAEGHIFPRGIPHPPSHNA